VWNTTKNMTLSFINKGGGHMHQLSQHKGLIQGYKKQLGTLKRIMLDNFIALVSYIWQELEG
jgi:hypothetical protein